MTDSGPVTSARRPIEVGSYLVGVFVGTCVLLFLAVASEVGRGNPDAGISLVVYLLILPFVWLVPAAIGTPIFLLLRKWVPGAGYLRAGFIMMVLAPAVVFVATIAASWRSLRTEYTASSIAQATSDAIANQWAQLLTIAVAGGIVCWGLDQRALLASADRSVRRKARFVLLAVLLAPVLPYMLLRMCNQFVVAWRAEQIAGDRPYCILVPNPRNYPQYYAQATSRSQLSYSSMSALYTFVSGSRGGFWATNHGVLVLDNPREFLNWSYRAENFVQDPLNPKYIKPCETRPHFVSSLD